MKTILWIGNPFFVNALKLCGWENVYYYSFTNLTIFTWDKLVKIAQTEPDILVVADKSMPPFVLGMEDFPCLTVFYAVDSHVHSWYPHYAQAFDLCLVSLKDHLPLFVGEHLPADRVLWSPPFAFDYIREPTICVPKRWDCIFVGSINQATPKRAVFLSELQAKMPSLNITTGNFMKLYPQARVVLNFCELGDLNF
ncbi:MAG: glycosyltransferase family 1 protein, partial [Desulfovibrio sp.]|nr:glycosyltransferase family 1 protein [Desulfovibrio sp.]